MASSASPSAVHIFNPDGHPSLAAEYSHVSIAQLKPGSKLISFAGQVGFNNETKSIPPALAEQVAEALANVDKCLVSVGATKKDIVSVRHYVTRLSQLSAEDQKARTNAVLKWWDGLTPPPATLIGVESLAFSELLTEIEATVVIN